MAVKPGAQPQQATKVTQAPQSTPDLRNQLLKRLAVAGGLVAVLLAVLAAFDYMSQPVDDVPVRVFSEPVPVAPKKMVTQPVVPLVQEPEVAVAPPVPAQAEGAVASEVPAGAEPAPTPLPAPPVVQRQDSPTLSRQQAAVRPEASVRTQLPSRPITPLAESPGAKAVQPEVPAVPERTAAPPMIAAQPETTRSPAQPSATVLDTRPAAGGKMPAAPKLFSGFVLQAGIFTSVERAEALHAQLTLSGVPSQIETRVQVGPFRTRQEAAEAQKKLRELGIETVLVPPAAGR